LADAEARCLTARICAAGGCNGRQPFAGPRANGASSGRSGSGAGRACHWARCPRDPIVAAAFPSAASLLPVWHPADEFRLFARAQAAELRPLGRCARADDNPRRHVCRRLDNVGPGGPAREEQAPQRATTRSRIVASRENRRMETPARGKQIGACRTRKRTGVLAERDPSGGENEEPARSE
jgi:hypothetical protein